MKGIVLAGGSGTAALSRHARRLKAINADLRQTDDLLPAQHFNAVGDTRYSDHYNAGRSPRL